MAEALNDRFGRARHPNSPRVDIVLPPRYRFADLPEKTMRKYILFAAALLGAATPLFAAESNPVAKTSDAPKKERKICREEGDTGSIIPKRTCHTAEDWRAIDAQMAKNTDTMNSMKHSGNGH